MSAKSGRPYSRCYYVDLERDYPDVYHDPLLYATYMWMLNAAEAAWPAIPEIPRSVRTVHVTALVEAKKVDGTVGGLVIRCGRFGYRIKGLDAERTARSNAGRTGATSRWGNADRNADSNAYGNAYGKADRTANAMPNRAEPNQTEIPPPPTSGGRRVDGTNRRANGEAPRDKSTNPRSLGTSIRQERIARKRGPSALHQILTAIQAGAEDD